MFHLLTIKRLILYTLLSVYFISNSIAKIDSLMLSPQEELAIDQALNQDSIDHKTNCEFQPLFLGAILYFTPKHWTLWINEQAISPEQNNNIIKIYKVTPDYVTLCVPSLSKKKFLIKPNQTFFPSLCKVMDGDHRIKIQETSDAALKKSNQL